MKVVTGRVRHAYLKKRSKRQMFAFTVVMAVFMGVLGFAATEDERSAQELAAELTKAHRSGIVARWYSPERGEYASVE